MLLKKWEGLQQSIADLKGKTVGIVTDNSYGADFDNNKDVQKDSSPDLDTQIRKLIGGRIPLIAVNETVGWYNIKKQGGKDIRALDLVLDKETDYIGISKKSPSSKEFFDKVSKALAELEKSGEIAKIKKKYSGQ